MSSSSTSSFAFGAPSGAGFSLPSGTVACNPAALNATMLSEAATPQASGAFAAPPAPLLAASGGTFAAAPLGAQPPLFAAAFLDSSSPFPGWMGSPLPSPRPSDASVVSGTHLIPFPNVLSAAVSSAAVFSVAASPDGGVPVSAAVTSPAAVFSFAVPSGGEGPFSTAAASLVAAFPPVAPPAADFTFRWPPPRRRPPLPLPPFQAAELLLALQLLSAAELLLLGLQQLRFHVLFHLCRLLLLCPLFPLSPLSAAIFLSFLLLLLLRLYLRKVWFTVHRARSSAILLFRLPPPPLAVSLPRPVRLRKTFSVHSPRCRLVFQILAPCHRRLALRFRPCSDKPLPGTVIFHHRPVLSNSRDRRRRRGLLGLCFREQRRLQWQAPSLRR